MASQSSAYQTNTTVELEQGFAKEIEIKSKADPTTNPPSPAIRRPVSSTATTPTPRVDHMLLLHGYPIFYILLWLPGLANRLVSVFHTPPLSLSALQSSTQFVGLVNALTYGYNENIKRQLKVWYGRRSGWVFSTL